MTILVARIGKPHGLRGEVTVQLHTDQPQVRFAVGTRFDTQARSGSGVPRALTVSSAREHRGIWLLGFEEVPDRTGAESLRGTQLELDDAASEPVDVDDEESWYEDDLVGLAAYDPHGLPLGEVSGLRTGAAQDLLVLRLPDGHEVLVPFVAALVPTVDVDRGRVVVDAPAGLLDLGRDG